jgi:hypothetical protein
MVPALLVVSMLSQERMIQASKPIIHSSSFLASLRGARGCFRLRGGADVSETVHLSGAEPPPPGDVLGRLPIAERMRAVWELKDLLAAKKASREEQHVRDDHGDDNDKDDDVAAAQKDEADLGLAERWLKDPSALVRHEVREVMMHTCIHMFTVSACITHVLYGIV